MPSFFSPSSSHHQPAPPVWCSNQNPVGSPCSPPISSPSLFFENTRQVSGAQGISQLHPTAASAVLARQPLSPATRLLPVHPGGWPSPSLPFPSSEPQTREVFSGYHLLLSPRMSRPPSQSPEITQHLAVLPIPATDRTSDHMNDLTHISPFHTSIP